MNIKDIQEYYIICDIDWTIANLDHRVHFIDGTDWKKDYDSFYLACKDDKPIRPVINLVKKYKWKVIFVSWRRYECLQDTIEWLDTHWLEKLKDYKSIYLRNEWDYREDTIIKSEIYEKYLSSLNIQFVIDDRPKVVKMWRDKWLFTIDVNHRWDF
jgi:uncharacterized pyridoxamine 5'-phosphate oxidase family protein